MRRVTFSVALIVCLSTCTVGDQLPIGVLAPQQMQDVLWDMLRADALTPELMRTDSNTKTSLKNIELYNKVFRVHNISKTIFQNSYTYYQNHPDLMRTLLDSMNAVQQRKMLKRFSQPKPVLDTAKS